MNLLARRRGIGALIYLIIAGFRDGNPWVIGISILVLLVIVGLVIYNKVNG